MRAYHGGINDGARCGNVVPVCSAAARDDADPLLPSLPTYSATDGDVRACVGYPQAREYDALASQSLH